MDGTVTLIQCLLQNGDPERAVDWLFNHPDEPAEPAESEGDNQTQKKSAGSKRQQDGDTTANLCILKKYLPIADATLPADFEVKSFVSHKGTSVHCGHYVAHVNKNGQWTLFNDNKVAAAPRPAASSDAYIFFLQRHP